MSGYSLIIGLFYFSIMKIAKNLESHQLTNYFFQKIPSYSE